MSKSGQSCVLANECRDHIFNEIYQYRHLDINTAIKQFSFKLTLWAQEIALLQIKEMAQLNTVGNDYTLFEVISLPATYTKVC